MTYICLSNLDYRIYSCISRKILVKIRHIFFQLDLYMSHRKKLQKWNIMPLFGHFGGRVGICSILLSPPLPLMLPSLSFSLIALSFLLPLGGCVHRRKLFIHGKAMVPYVQFSTNCGLDNFITVKSRTKSSTQPKIIQYRREL